MHPISRDCCTPTTALCYSLGRNIRHSRRNVHTGFNFIATGTSIATLFLKPMETFSVSARTDPACPHLQPCPKRRKFASRIRLIATTPSCFTRWPPASALPGAEIHARSFRHRIAESSGANTRNYDVTAVSFYAYPFVADKYILLDCGASFGEGYGPIVVSSHPHQENRIERAAKSPFPARAPPPISL